MRTWRSAVVALLLLMGVLAPVGAASGASTESAAPESSRTVDAPTRTGPYEVGRHTVTMPDPHRTGRTLDVDIWYPSDARQVRDKPKSEFDLLVTTAESPLAYASPGVSRDGPFPLVVFSHGSGGIRFQSWFLTEFLASHGYVVAAPDHAGNTALDGLFGTTTPFAVSARNRPLDVSLVIDRMLQRNGNPHSRFEGTIDPARIAVIGHSFGGFTALAMAAGHADVPPDPRVRAIVPIAPASGPFSDAQLESITVPMLLLGGTSDTTTPIVANTTRPWERASSKPRYRVDVMRAGHTSFTNICDLVDILIDAGLPPELLEALLANAADGCGPEFLPIERVQKITNLYTLAFLRWALDEDEGYLKYLTPGYVRSKNLPVTFFRKGGAVSP